MQGPVGPTGPNYPHIAFFVGRNATSNQTCAGGGICTVDFINGGPFDYNDGGKWNDGSNQFNADVSNAVYQYNVVIGYEGATVGSVLQVFLRAAGGDITRYQNTSISSSTGTVTLSATVKASTYGAGPIWIEVYSNNNIQISRFTSSFSGALIYAP